MLALGACSGSSDAGAGPSTTASAGFGEDSVPSEEELATDDAALDELLPDPTVPGFSDGADVPSSVVPKGAAHRKVLVTQQSLERGWRSDVSDLLGGGPSGVLAFLAQDCIPAETRSVLDEASSAWQLTAYPAGPEQDNVGYGALEARLFDDPAVAATAFDLVRDLLDGGIGRACLVSEVAGYYSVTAADVDQGPSAIGGVAAGLQLKVTTTEGLYYVEMVARPAGGGCVVVATFVTSDDPMDPFVAAALVATMVAG